MLPQTENDLLSAFPADARRRLDVRTVHHRAHDVLIEPGRPTESIFFPLLGTVVCVVRGSDSGTTVEVAVVGCDGLVGAETLLAPAATGSRAIVQIAGWIAHVPLEQGRRVMSDTVLRDILLAYCGSFLEQVEQNSICNRLHPSRERLAKWLLGVRDRALTDELRLTHDFLAQMLGVRRSGITVAVASLEADGLIRHARGRISIFDRDGLEDAACECYQVIARGAKETAREGGADG